MKKMETWKKINGFPKYEVSNIGRVRRFNKASKYDKRIKQYTYLKPQKDKRGYLRVVLYGEKGQLVRFIHRLVGEAFIPNNKNLPQINHKDENPSNNSVDNLEWCDNWYNAHYGNHIKKVKEKHYKKIVQYTMDNFFVNKWESIKEASIKNNIDSSSITKVCKGNRKSAGGYIWAYEGR